MKTYSDITEFIVSLMILTALSFTLFFCGYGFIAVTLQLMIVTAVIGDVILFLIYWEDIY